jgi:hypothetical protein
VEKTARKEYLWESQQERATRKTKNMWVGSTKMDIIEIRWRGMDWIGLAEDSDQWSALVNTVTSLRVPQKC